MPPEEFLYFLGILFFVIVVVAFVVVFCLFLKMRKLLQLASHLLWNQDWVAKVPFGISKEDVLYLSEIDLLIRTKCDFPQTSFPFSFEWGLQVLSIFSPCTFELLVTIGVCLP